MIDSLTIVIPYYKLRYLDAALGSLAAQTRQGFEVFVGDDASPEDPLPVLRKYEGRLNIRYHRFDANLGRASLVQHWNRCVRETSSEWVWLFSDDDIAAPDCMEAFLKTLAETQGRYRVYRFNTDMIDGTGAIIHRHPRHPQTEDVGEFALAKVLSERLSFAVEYVFRRSAFDAAGGFVDFPLAWFSDDASWVVFARAAGIRTMENGHVWWRKSGLNISSPNPGHVREKLAGFRRYLLWLEKEFPDRAFQARLKSAIQRTFPNQLQHWGGPPKAIDGLKFWFFFAKFTRGANLLLLRTFLGLTNFRRKLGFAPKARVHTTVSAG